MMASAKGCVCAMIWVMVILVAVAADKDATTDSSSFLSDIGKNLRSDMADVFEMANVTYSKPMINVTYNTYTPFDMRAMGSLYNATYLIIDFIVNKQAYPNGIVSVSDGHVEVASMRENWRVLLVHYAGPAAVLIIAALLVAALPLAGLFWCCCYWCKSGRRRRAFDRKYDACLKGLLAILLIALLTLFLCGVVCAFATEAALEEGGGRLGGAASAGLRDGERYLNASAAHAAHLLRDNYRDLELRVNGLLTSAGLAVSVHLGALSRAASVSALAQLLARLDSARNDLRAVSTLTAEMRSHADYLNAGLRKVKGQLLQTLAQCEQPPCVRLQEKYKIGQLDTEIQYNQMPDVTELLQNVSLLLDSSVRAEVAAGQHVFRDIQRGVQRSVDAGLPPVHAALRDAGRQLDAAASDIERAAWDASAALRRAAEGAQRLQREYDRVAPYRRVAGLAVAAALLSVTVLMALGVTCGVCGKRPDAYGTNDCCSKGTGSCCLLWGTGCMFLVGAVAAAALLVYFLVGTAGQRLLCDPLHEPRGSRVFQDVDTFAALPVAPSAALLRCHANNTIYETLELYRVYDIDAMVKKAQEEIESRTRELRPAYPHTTVVILKDSAKMKLRQLADAGLSDFNFDKILDAVETNLTSLSLEGLSAQLDRTAAGLAPRALYRNVAASLTDAARELQRLRVNAALPLAAAAAELASTATKLRDDLRFNHSSLKEAISYLMYETEQAEQYLNTQGPELVHNITQKLGSVVSGLVQQYLARLQHAAREEVGRCEPASKAINATADAVCSRILLPVNGFWVAMSWCLMLFVPLMVVAQRLARLYRHLDPYPGPLDHEYLYDAYADRDNVPLANAYKAEKRSGRSRGGGGPLGGGGGSRADAAGAGAGAALAPPLDAHHARRYNDMAPKHWEEGPPRYHGPTEYERPPPYYYPGPTDRQ